MKLTNYREVNPFRVAQGLHKIMKDYPNDDARLRDYIDDNYTILERVKPTPTKPYIRLTIPFYLLFVIVVVGVILPIKWLVTGSYYVKDKSLIQKVYLSWQKKLGF